MKIIQISDLHLLAPGALLYGEDPLAHLQACLADIDAHHRDADLVVLSGDLTDAGEHAAYEALREGLAGLLLPHRLMLGNHDHRQRFLEVFPDAVTEEGFVQSVLDCEAGRFLFLDTLEQGQVEGRLCERRLDWLSRRLDEAAGRAVYAFTHHPPFRLGMPMIDGCRLRDDGAFHALCVAHGDVRHVFSGHVHRPVAGTWRGIPFSAVKGTHHQAALQFSPDRFVTRMEPPGYALILIDGEGVVVHFHDFLIEAAEYAG